MKSYAWMFVLIAAFLFLVAGCGGQTGDLVEDISEDVAQEEDAQEEAVEESVERKAASEVLGVVVGFSESTDSPAITMLVDGSPEEYPVDDDIYQLVVEDWDHYSHWGLYQALIDDSGIVFSLEYGEGVADIIGIFSDYYTGKELPDVISFSDNVVTIINIDNLLDSDDPDDLPGFSTEINSDLTPANGESFTIAVDAVIYVEGSDGLFTNGDPSLIDAAGYDYIEFYDVNGDQQYNIVIVWLV